MNEQEFKTEVEKTFGLTYTTEKQKFAYDMIIWADKSGGTVWGSFAGHSHGQSIPGFAYHGWCFAKSENGWQLLGDGQNGWRHGENPFPEIPLNAALSVW